MSDVIVGYDGSGHSERALRWAVREAQLRRLPLTVIHAWRWPYPLKYIDYEGVSVVRRMAEHVLDQGVELARQLAPGLVVRKRLKDGGAASALLAEAVDAEVIVVGSHEPEEKTMGSTALRVSARADRPVVVVRSAAPADGLVVVGVDGSAGGDAALAFGFEEAVLRGWRLRAVCGGWDPGVVPGGDLSLFSDEEELRRVCGAMLERAVAPWRVKYPYVEATTSLVIESPREALLGAAEDAGLTVVGARGAGVTEPPRLGATSDALLKHSPSTVAVVPDLTV